MNNTASNPAYQRVSYTALSLLLLLFFQFPMHLKGQMMFMAEWGVIMFLSSPILSDLDSLNVNGLYVNDLPMHDFSRDLLFVGMYI